MHRITIRTHRKREILDIMEQRKITSLIVVDESQRLLGVLHLHDLWGTQML